MPRFGTHASVAGGLPLAVARAAALGCASLQIFTRNANRWLAPPLDRATARTFRDAVASGGMSPVVSHASYLVNLGAPDGPLRRQSLEAMADELRRAHALGLLGVVLHPGASGTDAPEVALDRIAAGLRVLLRETRRSPVMLLIEHTAGQGRSVGYRFEHLAHLLRGVNGAARVGVCLDSCHLLASGYDLTTDVGYVATFAAFDRLVGFDRLRVMHVNDSRRPLGSRVDRHAHIGEGYVGIEGFARLVNDPRMADLPMLLETEKQLVRRADDTSPDPLDQVNLARLRALVRRPAVSRSGASAGSAC